MTLKLLFAVVNVSLVVVYAFCSGLWVSTGGAFSRSPQRLWWTGLFALNVVPAGLTVPLVVIAWVLVAAFALVGVTAVGL
jgi:hypothetical protein